MLRKGISLAMVAGGMLMSLSGLGALVPPTATMAQSVPQPTPRPPLPPEGIGRSSELSLTTDMGHITGTVIDQASGAPVPNARVTIGDQTITADANGNYDLWVPAGTYIVALAAADGSQAQATSVELPPGQIVVRHLTAVSALAAPAAPAAPSLLTAEPTPEVKAAPIAEPAADEADLLTPGRLPHTASSPLFLDGAWFWVSLGLALVAGGILIGTRTDSLRLPARALASYARSTAARPGYGADAAALLAALLTTEIRAARPSEDALLQALLDTDMIRRRAAQELLSDLLRQPAVHAA